jgi:hypothetical protein
MLNATTDAVISHMHQVHGTQIFCDCRLLLDQCASTQFTPHFPPSIPSRLMLNAAGTCSASLSSVAAPQKSLCNGSVVLAPLCFLVCVL